MAPVVSFVGKSGSGKTTLLENLISELKRRGYRVAVVKHHLHDFEVDKPGKDSWRYMQAGSDVAVIAAPHKLAMVKRLDAEMSPEEIAALFPDVDIVLAEGYKSGARYKIEVVRRANSAQLVCAAPELLALVTDMNFAVSVPHFALDDTTGIANFLEKKFLPRE